MKPKFEFAGRYDDFTYAKSVRTQAAFLINFEFEIDFKSEMDTRLKTFYFILFTIEKKLNSQFQQDLMFGRLKNYYFYPMSFRRDEKSGQK